MTGYANYPGIAQGLSTYPAAAIPADTVSVAAVDSEIYNQLEKGIGTAAAVIPAGTATLFTVAGAPIVLTHLIAICITANDTTATLLKWTADGTDGAAVDLCAASATLASKAAGHSLTMTGTLATQMVQNTAGVAIEQAIGIYIPIGVIQTITTGGATTGTWRHYMRYKPLGRGCLVS